MSNLFGITRSDLEEYFLSIGVIFLFYLCFIKFLDCCFRNSYLFWLILYVF